MILIEISAKIADFTVEMRKFGGVFRPINNFKNCIENSRFLKYSVRLEAQEIKYEVISRTYY